MKSFYRWLVALAAVAVGAGLTALFVFDVSEADLAAIGIALTTITTAVTVLKELGERRKPQDQAGGDRTGPRIVESPRAPATPLGERESLGLYIGQMRQRLLDLGAEQERFVALTTTADAEKLAPSPGLESLERRRGEGFVRAESQPIDLLDIPDRFKRAVLLGEPGSGKSTCLRRLAFLALDRLEETLDDPPGGAHDVEDPPLIPFYVPLSEWRDPEIGAHEFLRSRLENLLGSGNWYVQNFETLIAAGRFLFLLDGLNELPRRKASQHEGRHERRRDEMQVLHPERIRIDPRERSLRELAKEQIGLRSRFVLSCRSHEYADSLEWQVVRVLAMRPEQVDRFIGAYLDEPIAADLRRAMRANAALSAVANNPFFLRSVIEIWAPGLQLDSRGEILEYLYRTLLARERSRRDDASIAEDTLIDVVGRRAFQMFDRGEIGSQTPLGLQAGGRARAQALLDMGLLIERDGEVFFLHQIIQEFFAAAALRARVVRRRPATMLADARWSEVVALWYDLEPDRLYRKLVRCLRARNLPWRQPLSKPSVGLSTYNGFTSLAILLTGAAYLVEWILWPLPTLPPPFGILEFSPLVALAAVLAVRLFWTSLIPHRQITVNTSHVLALTREPSAVIEIIPGFARLWQADREAVAQSVARFGSVARPHVVNGLEDPRWRVRWGCVQTLGEFLQDDPEDEEVIETLLAVARADDPQLVRPLVEALGRCDDPRVGDAIATIVDRAGANQLAMHYRLQPLIEARTRPATQWNEAMIARLDELTAPDRPSTVRSVTLRAMGALRLPGCVERLAKAAEEATDDAVLQGAIAGLGLAQTEEAVDALVMLGEESLAASEVTAKVLRTVRDPSARPALVRAAEAKVPATREAAAIALGATGTTEVLPVLETLARDTVPAVRSATAVALGAVQSSGAVPALSALARDGIAPVREAALDALTQRYPDHAATVLLELAADGNHEERVRAIRLLGRYPQPEVTHAVRQLTADPDKTVRDAAQAALATLSEVTARRSLVVRGSRRHPVRALRGLVAKKLDIDGLSEIWRDERVMGFTKTDAFNRMFMRINADAELTRRFRVALRVYGAGFLVACVLVAVLVVSLLWLALWAATLLVGVWKITAAVIVVSLASLLPRVRELRNTRGGFLVAALRGLAGTAAVVLALGAILYTWWIWLLLIVAIALVMGLRYRRALVSRRRTVSAELAAARLVAAA